MGIFQVAPETVRSRLEELRRSPDTAPLLKIPRLIPLLIYHTRTKPKLPFLRLMKAKCINYRILGKIQFYLSCIYTKISFNEIF